MQKVYKLLRNNQETGPYTLDEILLLNLKPFDLVWVEGRSAAWRYPSEIDTLKPFVPAVPQPQTPFEPLQTAVMEEGQAPIRSEKPGVPKKIFVSMPGQVQQASQKPEAASPPPAIQQEHKLYAGLTEPSNIPANDTLQTKYSKTLDNVEEDYTNWVYNQKAQQKSKFSKRDIAIAALVVVLIIGGYFIISRPSIVQPLAEQSSIPIQNIGQATPANSQATTTQTTQTTHDPVEDHTALAIVSKKQKKTVGSKTTPVVLEHNQSGPRDEIQNDVSVKVEPKESNTVTNTAPDKTEKLPVESKEKKKKFGEVVKGIFSKKDKKQDQNETVLEEPRSASNRQSTKRNVESEPNPEINNEGLANLVEVSSNAPDNWMMGVSGLKLTLRNRNNTALQTAAVQVLYYDENNQLLDRKSVYFNNVPAKGKATQAAPDHKFADHVEFKVLAVSAKEDHYASN